jgi:subtilisin family serine protease
MARGGALLESVRRLGARLSAEDVITMPEPPLPARVYALFGLRVELLVTLSPECGQALDEMVHRGLQITTRTETVAAGSAAVEALDGLLDVDGDLFVEAAHAVRPALDLSVPEAWNAVSVPPGSGAGRGVFIGIVDSGIDLAHLSFRNPDGTTRVRRLWCQPAFAMPGGTVVPYGVAVDESEINHHLTTSIPIPSDWDDPSGHGTAVAGVAAGSGQPYPGAPTYVGLAQEADLVVVAIEARRGAFASTANVIDGVRHAFEYAEERGQRAVVNISQGVQTGVHSPAGDLERALASLVAENDQRIVVVSAGNTAEADAHSSVQVPDGGSVDLPIDVPGQVGNFILVDLWYDRADRLAVELADPTGSRSAVVEGNRRASAGIGVDQYEIDGVPNVLFVAASQLQVKLLGANYRGDITPGRWTLTLHGRSMTSGRPVHGWLDQGMVRSPKFDSRVADPDCTVTGPATATGVFGVGSYLMGQGQRGLAGSSGRGPDRDDQAIELIAAPGDPITTCAAAPTATPFTTKRGTSVAAPHVTGAIALMLEANPSLSRSQVIDCLARTARCDADVASGPVTGWGAGKLDVSAALACARGQP